MLADEIIACADAGFVSYVPRDAPYAELIKIARMALQGEMPCDPRVSRLLLDEIHRRRTPDEGPDSASERLEALTRRETETLELLGRGLSNKEIASELGLWLLRPA